MKIKNIAANVVLGLLCTTPQVQASGMIQVKSDFIRSDYAKTKYPIVMAHGMMGFTRLGTQAFGLDYWYQITPDLARNGASVYATQVSPFNTSEIRGEQLLQQIDEVIALTGKPKVNLIGHSHGGPSVQYIEVIAPEKVASATAIAGSFKGSPLAETVLQSHFLHPIVEFIVNFLSPTITHLEGSPELPYDFEGSFKSISVAGSDDFNKKYPTAAIPKDCNSEGQKITANGIYHFSWIGNKQVTNVLDVVDSGFGVLGGSLIGNMPNDSLVPICSAKYGQVIRNNYNWNHFDEVNQVLGLRGLFSQDPVQVFREHANRLKLQGL